MDQIEQVKQAHDIVQVIGARIKLQRSGKQFRGLCPFHSEKSPSFFVSPDLQRYKCFGCGKGGDLFTFLQEYDNLTFAEVLQLLAEQAGITLEKTSMNKSDLIRKELFELLSLSSEYYHYLLTEHPSGETGRAYLSSRGVSQDSIKLFKLGFAVDDWFGLFTYLTKKKKYSPELLEKAGLVIKSQHGKYYDRFRGRVIFPLYDSMGRVAGFSGRTLLKDAKEAKYINSPETEVYHKSEILFGYSQLKQFIRTSQEVVLVEGELDVISSFQAGVKNICAIKGSAFTTQQAKLLARSSKKLILSLDADSAGIAATTRAIEIASSFEISVRVGRITGGKDPDEMARTNPVGWRSLIKSAIPAYEFLIRSAIESHDLSSGEGVLEASRAAVPILLLMKNYVEQAHYIKLIASLLHTTEDVVQKELQRLQQSAKLGNSEQYSRSEPSPSHSDQDNEAGSIPAHEKYAISLLLHVIGEQQLDSISLFSEEWFTNRSSRMFFSFLKKYAPIKVSEILNKLESQWHALFTEFFLYLDQFRSQQEWSAEEFVKELKQSASHLKEQWKKQRLQDLSQRLPVSSPEEKIVLQDELRQLLQQ